MPSVASTWPPGAAWLRRSVQRLVRRQGGSPTAGARVNGATTLLVRGDSSVWAFGDHGTKENQAARLLSLGTPISMVYDGEFRRLIEEGKPARIADRIAGEPVQWLAPANKKEFERAASQSGSLDREHTALGRIEQSYLRHTLFRGAVHATCALCHTRLPVGLLVAAHVKPRSECSKRERLDVENIVFGICLLGCDALYERGLIAVGRGGRVLISAAQDNAALAAILKRFRGRTCPAWNPATAPYFEWHRIQRYRGAMAKGHPR